MKLGLFITSLFGIALVAGIASCTEPVGPSTPTVVQIPQAEIIQVPLDTAFSQSDSCQERISTLQTLEGCPAYVGGLINGLYFSGLSDVNERESLGLNYFVVAIRSYIEGGLYAFEMFCTFNGEPEIGVSKPLKTDGYNLAGINTVDPDSVYVLLAVWLDYADINPPIAYKVVSGLPNQIRVDSSSYTTYDGEPVTDHFGALEATLVLNQTEYIQDNVAYYEDRGYCVPDTIFLRDVCFDARTRDVFSPCDRVPGR